MKVHCKNECGYFVEMLFWEWARTCIKSKTFKIIECFSCSMRSFLDKKGCQDVKIETITPDMIEGK